jgi:hypothetical protein
MRRQFMIILALLALTACGSTKRTASGEEGSETVEQQNRVGMTLLNRIRRLPGITLRSGVPVFTKSSAEINSGGSFEPLYVLNGYPVGNSFRDVDQLVDNVNVVKIEVMSASESSFYGSRGSNGVILITTTQ